MSPFQPEKVAFEAGRIMLNRINELFTVKENFALETTLATKIYKSKIIEAQNNNYKVSLLFFWLENVELAIDRVKTRVTEGGHNIPEDVIRRRYKSGIKNLFSIYLPIVDEAMIFDNSNGKPQLLATKTLNNLIEILNFDKYSKLKRHDGNQ